MLDSGRVYERATTKSIWEPHEVYVSKLHKRHTPKDLVDFADLVQPVFSY